MCWHREYVSKLFATYLVMAPVLRWIDFQTHLRTKSFYISDFPTLFGVGFHLFQKRLLRSHYQTYRYKAINDKTQMLCHNGVSLNSHSKDLTYALGNQ